MLSYIIAGERKLEGEIEISGSKNAALPIMAASILNAEITTLYNVPNIFDAITMKEILTNLGCTIKVKKSKFIINSDDMCKTEIPQELMSKMRSSVMLAGAILGRFKQATFSYPGGCDIGSRPIDLHLKAFEKLGIKIEENYGYIVCKCDKIIGTNINLDFPSVGATENIMMATVMAEGETVITNAAMEPEIIDLQCFLNRMGANITGAGTNCITIIGVKKLHSVSYNIMPDRIETGTFLCIGAATHSKLKLNNTVFEHVKPIIGKLEDAGVKIQVEKNYIYVESNNRLKSVDIKTLPYPGFPTDMQSIFASTVLKAKGTSVIVENIFENRYKYINEFRKMGAKIDIEGRIAIINGVKRLVGTTVLATDLRGGTALCIAALSAKGKTTINNIEHILRGYENFSKKLNDIGAEVLLK